MISFQKLFFQSDCVCLCVCEARRRGHVSALVVGGNGDQAAAPGWITRDTSQNTMDVGVSDDLKKRKGTRFSVFRE